MNNKVYGIWDVIKDFFKGELKWIGVETFSVRHQLCDSCDAKDIATNTCTICSCYLPIKQRLQKSKCPMELW